VCDCTTDAELLTHSMDYVLFRVEAPSSKLVIKEISIGLTMHAPTPKILQYAHPGLGPRFPLASIQQPLHFG